MPPPSTLGAVRPGAPGMRWNQHGPLRGKANQERAGIALAHCHLPLSPCYPGVPPKHSSCQQLPCSPLRRKAMPSPCKSAVTTAASSTSLLHLLSFLAFFLVFPSPIPSWFGRGLGGDRIILLNVFIWNLKRWRRYKDVLCPVPSLPGTHLLGFKFSIHSHGPSGLGHQSLSALGPQLSEKHLLRGPHVPAPSLFSLNCLPPWVAFCPLTPCPSSLSFFPHQLPVIHFQPHLHPP